MIIKLKNISKSFQDGEQKTEILKNINLDIKKDDFITLLGVSGSGKTTLLNIIMGIESISSGNIEKKENIISGYITQQAHFFDEINIYENLMFAAFKNKKFSNIEKYSNYFECSHLLKKKPKNLSGGEKQRINIIRALVLNPNLLILDEPTAALDYDNKHKVINILNDIHKKENISIILVTHDRDILKSINYNKILELKNKELTEITL